MPTCKKCNLHFPNHNLVEGKIRNACKRKYCFNCSPFGKHNTRSLTENKSNLHCVCKKCNKEYSYSRGKGTTRQFCASCLVNKGRYKRKERAVTYKGGACERCGYNKCYTALHFHHLDPNQKIFSIGGRHCLSWEKVRLELDKCILLCSNCHAEERELKQRPMVYGAQPVL